MIRKIAIALASFFFLSFNPNTWAQIVTQVDLTPEYDSLSRFANGSDIIEQIIPSKNFSINTITEFDNFFLIRPSQNDFYQQTDILFWSKQTREFYSPKDLLGESADSAEILYEYHAYELSSDQLILSRQTVGGPLDWYVTDGTKSNTRPWVAPPLTTIYYLTKLNETFLVRTPRGFYIWDDRTETLEQVSGLATNPVQSIIGNYYAHIDKVNNKILVSDGTVEGTVTIEQNSDKVFARNLTMTEKLKQGSGQLFFVRDIDGSGIFSGVDGTNGITDYFSTSDLTPCGTEDLEAKMAFNKGVHVNADYVFFTTVDAQNAAQQCFVRVNLKTKTIKTYKANNYWEAVTAVDGELVITDTRISPYILDNYRLLTIDFDNNDSKHLFPEGDSGIYFSIIGHDQNYLFGFLTLRSGSENVHESDEIFRLDLRTGEKHTFGSRFGVLDENHLITASSNASTSSSAGEKFGTDLQNFIIDGQMYFLASLPYPGIYRTNTETNNFNLMTFPDSSSRTASKVGFGSSYQYVFPYANGWLITDDDNDRFFDVRPDGTFKKVGANNLSGLLSRILFTESDGKYYFFGNTLKEYSPELGLVTDIVDIKFPDTVIQNIFDVVDSIAYGVDKEGENIQYDINSESITKLNTDSINSVFKCGDTIFGFNGVKQDTIPRRLDKGAYLVANLYIKDNGKFEPFSPFPNSSGQINLNQSALSDNKLLFLNPTHKLVYDCAGSKIQEAHEFSLDDSVTNRIRYFSYNEFEQTFYVSEMANTDGIYRTKSIYRIDEKTSSWSILYRQLSQNNSEPFQLLHTVNGIFLVDYYYRDNDNKFFKLINEELIDPIMIDDINIRHRYNYVNVVMPEGRYLIGEVAKDTYHDETNPLEGYRTSKGFKPFVFDTQNNQIIQLNLNNSFERTIIDIQNETKPNLGYYGYQSNTDLVKQGFTIIDIACAVNIICQDKKVNRVPIVDNALTLYLNKNANLYLPLRSTDQDEDALTFRLHNAPDWLTIDQEGLVSGTVPIEAASQYSFNVVVFDGMSETMTETFIVNIDNTEPPPSITPTPPPVTNPTPITPQPPAVAGETSGGGAFNLWLLCIIALVSFARNSSAWYCNVKRPAKVQFQHLT